MTVFLLCVLCLMILGIPFALCRDIKTTTGGAAIFYLPKFSIHCGPYKLVAPNNFTVVNVDGIGVVLNYEQYGDRANYEKLQNDTIMLGLHRVSEADTGTYLLLYQPTGLYCPTQYYSVSLTDESPHWLDWSPWSPCTRTCGINGVKHRQRMCSKRGRCTGDYEEQERCRLDPCEHSYWLGWSEWSSCSITCGEGIKTRSRSCSSGSGCEGHDEDRTVCKQRECIQAAWTDWSRWVVCDVTCGGGRSYRTRQCRSRDLSTEACLGSDREEIVCNTQLCPSLQITPRERPPTSYTWTRWSVWSQCNLQCGREVRRRTRTCADDSRGHVPPGYCGNVDNEETLSCRHPPCRGDKIGPGRSSSTTSDQTTAKDIGITVPLSGIVGSVAVLFILILLVVVIVLVVRLRKKNNNRRSVIVRGVFDNRLILKHRMLKHFIRLPQIDTSIKTNSSKKRKGSRSKQKKPVSICEESESHFYAEIDEEVYQKRDKSKSIVTLDNPYSDLPSSVTPTNKYPGPTDTQTDTQADTAIYTNSDMEPRVFLFTSDAVPAEPKLEPSGQDGGYLTCTPTSSNEQLERQLKRYVKRKT